MFDLMLLLLKKRTSNNQLGSNVPGIRGIRTYVGVFFFLLNFLKAVQVVTVSVNIPLNSYPGYLSVIGLIRLKTLGSRP